METIRMGPIGRKSRYDETEWDDVGHNIISHIIVSFKTTGVKSIQFGYVKNGALVMSKMYGASPVGCSIRIVRLKHDSEFVTGLSGEICGGYITSLTIHTNQRKHEAVHMMRVASRFIIPEKIELHSGILECGEFGGFFGTYCASNLTSIGFHVRLALPDVKTIKKEKV